MDVVSYLISAYLSNHSGKLVLIAWKLSSFSFVRSKLNLQPLGKRIRSWWKGFRVAHTLWICRLCIGAPQKRCQEKILCAGMLEMRTLADPGLYREQRRSQEGCKHVRITITFFWKHTVLPCLSPLDSNDWHVPFVYLECHYSNYFILHSYVVHLVI